jgi:hypothetical protein
MGEVIRFVSKSERERIRLIRQARAFYESVFPPAAPVGKQRDNAAASDEIGDADAYRNDGVALS